MPMLPEVVEMLGGKAFDIQVEFVVSGFIAVFCVLALVYVQLFLDVNLKPKSEPFESMPRLFFKSNCAEKGQKKDWVDDLVISLCAFACGYEAYWNHETLEVTKIVVFPSSAGGNFSFELHSQSTERDTLDRYHHFHGHSGICAWLALRYTLRFFAFHL